MLFTSIMCLAFHVHTSSSLEDPTTMHDSMRNHIHLKIDVIQIKPHLTPPLESDVLSKTKLYVVTHWYGFMTSYVLCGVNTYN